MTMPRDDVPNSSGGGATAGEIDQQSSGGGTRAQMRDVKEKVADVKGKVVEEAKSSIRQVRDSASASLSQSRTRAADSLESIANAVRSTGDRLRSENRTSVADLSESLADQVGQLSSYLRTRDFRGVREDVERFARRQPSVAIGVALALGVLGARFIKSSKRGAGGGGYGPGALPAGGGYGGV
jgi:hypothetical protein